MANEQTKNCPKCKEEIKNDAKKCKHCGADLRKWFARHKILSVILGFILLSIIVSASSDDNANKSENYFPNADYKDINVTQEAQDKLELLNYKCYKQYNFFYIEGQVKNITDKSLESVVAVGSAYTASDAFVTSDEALIEYNPILAGQTSPFKVMISNNPEIDRCKIEFKEFFGGTIPTKRSIQ